MCELTEHFLKLFQRPSRETVRQWGILLSVLVVTHLLSFMQGYGNLQFPPKDKPGWVYGEATTGLPLSASIDDWIPAAMTAMEDCGTYLAVAKNYADGQGMVGPAAPNALDQKVPFTTWGPGAPWVMGEWLYWTGGKTIASLYIFSGLVQLLWGVVIVATAALFTQRTWALSVTAFLTGCCPPLHRWFYSGTLTSSEIVALLPLGLMTFALCKAFMLQRTPGARQRDIMLWFAVAGLWLGLSSLVRDSLAQFAVFVAVFLLIRGGFGGWSRIGRSLAYGAALVAVTQLARLPVELWNLNRIGSAVVSSSSQGAIWRTGLWDKHDRFGWYDIYGIGIGEYLDPEAAQRVNDYFDSGKPHAEWYSLGQYVQALWHHPLGALQWRAERAPLMWLGTDRWPKFEQHGDWFGTILRWCIVAYAAFFLYVGARLLARRPIPEPLYLYPLFLICATPLIHSEFRYSFPCWNMLVVLPALWQAHLAERRATVAATATAPIAPVEPHLSRVLASS